MSPTNQERLSKLYATPYEQLTPAQRMQRMSLHTLLMRELDDLIDSINHAKK